MEAIMTRYAHVILMLCVYCERVRHRLHLQRRLHCTIALIFKTSLSFLPFRIIPCRRDNMHLSCPTFV
jgi:hypothetical protein